VLPNQKKQCFKIARFTDAPCTFTYHYCCIDLTNWQYC
jgi:hypothetical protein